VRDRDLLRLSQVPRQFIPGRRKFPKKERMLTSLERRINNLPPEKRKHPFVSYWCRPGQFLSACSINVGFSFDQVFTLWL
jgi:hypothetical protein